MGVKGRSSEVRKGCASSKGSEIMDIYQESVSSHRVNIVLL